MQNFIDSKFWSDEYFGYYFSEKDESLIVRYLDFSDSARPNSNAMAVLNLYKLYFLTLDKKYKEKATQMITKHQASVARMPLSFTQILLSDLFFNENPKQAIIVFKNEIDWEHSFVKHIRKNYLPNIVFIPIVEGKKSKIQFIAGKTTINEQPTAYICLDGVCKLPTNEFDVFVKQLSEK